MYIVHADYSFFLIGITVANATATVGIDCNEFGYYNGNNSGCDLTYQPCYYTVRVEEVYKGNLQVKSDPQFYMLHRLKF